MKRIRLNKNLIAQWSAVILISSFLLSAFVTACRWYGSGKLETDDFFKHSLCLVLCLLVAGIAFAIALIYEKRKALKTRRQHKDTREIIISYDIHQAKKDMRYIAIISIGFMSFVGLFLMIFQKKYGEAPWYALIIIGCIVAIGTTSPWLAYRKFKGRRWIIEPDGVRYEPQKGETVTIKWNEVEKIKIAPLTLGNGDTAFTMPYIQGAENSAERFDQYIEATRRIKKHLRPRFDLDESKRFRMPPLKQFFYYLAVSIPGLASWLGWLIFSIKQDYSSTLALAPLFLIPAPFYVHAIRQKNCWRTPVNKANE